MRCNVEVVLKMEQTQNTEAREEARVNWNASGPATRDNAKEVLETRLSCLSRGTAFIHDLHFPTSPQPHFPTLQALPPPTQTHTRHGIRLRAVVQCRIMVYHSLRITNCRKASPQQRTEHAPWRAWTWSIYAA